MTNKACFQSYSRIIDFIISFFISNRLILCFIVLISTQFLGYGQSTSKIVGKLKVRNDFNLAIRFYNQKSYSISIPYFIEVLKKDSDHFFARYYLSLAFFKVGRSDEAIREMENLIRIKGLNRSLESKINFFSRQKFLETTPKNFKRYVWVRDYPNEEVLKASLGGTLNPFSIVRNQNYRIRMPSHLRVNKHNELEVLDFSLKKFFTLDGEGVLLDEIYKKISTPLYLDQLSGPWAFVKSGDKFWVTDFLKDNIKVINSEGAIEAVYGSKGTGETNFLGIKGITTDQNGNFYIVDSGNGRIQFRNQRGEWLKNIGYRGNAPDTLLSPTDVAYDQKRNQLFVLDKGNKKISVFSSEGEFLSNLFDTEILSNPQKLYIDNPLNPIYLYILDKKKLYRYQLEKKKIEELELNRKTPSSISSTLFSSLALSKDGYLYLGNALREKIEVYTPVEKTYINLPVMVDEINIQKFPLVKLSVGVKDLIGYPVKFLQSRNFSLYENNIAIPFKLLPNPRTRRIVLLVEKSTVAQKKEFAIKSFMGGLFNQLGGDDGVKVITYNRNGYVDQTPFSLFKLAATEKATLNDYTSRFVVDKALMATVNYTKDTRVKNAVVMLAFSPYQAVNFQKKYTDVVSTLKNNDIPVYIFYAGVDDKQSLFYLKNLSQQTRGRFYFYNKGALDKFKNDFDNYHNGIYALQYLTTSNPRNSGVFRRVVVKVHYKNSQGEDSLAGYPVP